MASSIGGSPLSSVPSEEDPFDQEHDDENADTTEIMPPAKRQRTGYTSMRATPTLPAVEDDGYISSDTDSEMPIPEPNSRPDDEDTHEQVTVCSWTGCDAGDLGNMDRLVDHIHAEHIETRQKKYTCEWSDCNRKSIAHASGYALKAHMRSHTREKPFYCALPECDRAFTRSDALAKHMRTVHETEALRPSDPIPKALLASMQSHPKLASKLKIAIKTPQPDGQTPPPTNGTSNGYEPSEWTTSYPPELFTADEEAMHPKLLYESLRRRLRWAKEEANELKKSVVEMEELRKREWMEKEILLDQAIRTDISWHERRKEVLAGLADIPTAVITAAVSADQDRNKANSPLPASSAISEIPAPVIKPAVEEPPTVPEKTDSAALLAPDAASVIV